MADGREGKERGADEVQEQEGRARLEEKVAARWTEMARQKAKEQNWTLTAELEGAICATTMSVVRETARDVRHFARHAGRDVVEVEDVSLCARRNPSLQQALAERAPVPTPP